MCSVSVDSELYLGNSPKDEGSTKLTLIKTSVWWVSEEWFPWG